MQLWFTRGSGTPIHEQLVTQIVLGILCEELVSGQRLPSTRSLAQRFDLHPNTVSAGYRRLVRDGWLEVRRGSGVYVKNRKPAALSADLAPDERIAQLIAQLVRSARKLDVAIPLLRAGLRQWLMSQPPERFLVIEPDKELRQILINEMRKVITLSISGCSPEDCGVPGTMEGAIPVVLPSKVEAVRRVIPVGTEIIALHVQSIPTSLAKYLPAPDGLLIGIASRWSAFLTFAHTMLIAAGFHPDSLVTRNTGEPGWQQDLESATAVVCDSVTAAEMPNRKWVLCFSLLSDSSLNELQRYQEFIQGADISSLDVSLVKVTQARG
jgi:DNA-binding transcriptional regulator YhcF (GntR family)